MSWEVLEADCVEAMGEMDEASVDAVVTDPPYNLGFMSRPWDIQHDHEPWSREAFRVLKPGGHLLAFGGTRTYHRLACAVEDAGFEIRDSVIWLYGSGFPKSLAVDKAIDRANEERHAEALVVTRAIEAAMRDKGLTRRDLNREVLGVDWHGGSAQSWTTLTADGAHKPRVPGWDYWLRVKVLLDISDDLDAEVWRLNGRKGKPGENWEKRELLEERTMVQGGGNAYQLREGEVREVEANITAPATPEAQRWQGWGTALKPAHEPIVVARKPLVGTVAQNVERFGTGALNIDGCRIEGTKEGDPERFLTSTRPTDRTFGKGGEDGDGGMFDPERPIGVRVEQDGRWPSNVALSHLPECEEEACAETCPVAELDRQSGERPGATSNSDGRTAWFGGKPSETAEGYGDTGGASRFFATFSDGPRWRCMGCGWEGNGSLLPDGLPPICPNCGSKSRVVEVAESRFFYVAKASRSERNAGLEAFEERLPDNAIDRASQREGLEGAAGRGSLTKPMANVHPTVKPVELMRWLVRLVTPPDGTVLDPFCGSGTTGIACVLEDFDFIGIERESEYVEIAKARIDYWAKQPKQLDLLDAA